MRLLPSEKFTITAPRSSGVPYAERLVKPCTSLLSCDVGPRQERKGSGPSKTVGIGVVAGLICVKAAQSNDEPLAGQRFRRFTRRRMRASQRAHVREQASAVTTCRHEKAVSSPTELCRYLESPFSWWMDHLLKNYPGDPR